MAKSSGGNNNNCVTLERPSRDQTARESESIRDLLKPDEHRLKQRTVAEGETSDVWTKHNFLRIRANQRVFRGYLRWASTQHQSNNTSLRLSQWSIMSIYQNRLNAELIYGWRVRESRTPTPITAIKTLRPIIKCLSSLWHKSSNGSHQTRVVIWPAVWTVNVPDSYRRKLVYQMTQSSTFTATILHSSQSDDPAIGRRTEGILQRH